MTIIEFFLKWSLVAIVGAMVVTGVGGAVFAGAMSIMGTPQFLIMLVIATVALVAMIGVPAVIGGAYLFRWWQRSAIDADHRAEFVSPDANGRLPVPASLLRSPEFAHRALDVHTASYMAGLTHYHNAPTWNNDHAGIADDSGISGNAALPLSVVPSFAELLQRGQIGNGRFMLGLDLTTGQSVTADWTGLYSGGIAGQQASGKTATVRNLLCQSLLNGADVAVIDPHAVYSEDSLSQSIEPLHSHLHTPIASDENDIVQMVRYTGTMMDARIAELTRDRNAPMRPFVLIVDEMMHLLENDTVSPDLNRLVKRLVSEGRKLKVYALTISHVYAANLFEKGSSVRALLGTRFVHTLDATQARVLVPNDYAKQAENLLQGQAILKANMLGTYRVGIPYCTIDDCEVVAEILSTRDGGKSEFLTSTGGSSALHHALPDTIFTDELPQEGSAGEVPNFTPNFKAIRVRELILQGKPQTEIIKEVWGVTGGKRYNDAIAEYNQILQKLLRN